MGGSQQVALAVFLLDAAFHPAQRSGVQRFLHAVQNQVIERGAGVEQVEERGLLNAEPDGCSGCVVAIADAVVLCTTRRSGWLN